MRTTSVLCVVNTVSSAPNPPHPTPLPACQIPWFSFLNLICMITFENSFYVLIYSLQLSQRRSCFRMERCSLLKSSLFVDARKMMALTRAVLKKGE